ncbi:MAG: arginine--tRNA ligase [candidate division NC10 bacterium]|nr:arginine--tRNA ligase [candidate division NC10 bacterium]
MLHRLKDTLAEALKEAVQRAIQSGELKIQEVPEISWETPSEAAFGDLSTTIAFSIAREIKKNPREVATAVAAQLGLDPNLVEKAEVAGPGYINFFISPACWRSAIPTILAQGKDYGRSEVGKGRRVQVEFVSANPTGPLHVGHGRGAAIGDSLANLLQAVGFSVEREYYINDAGTQMEILGRSVWARYQEELGREAAFPENGYKGGYIRDIARRLVSDYGERFLAVPEGETIDLMSAYASRIILGEIKEVLEEFGVKFDSWFSEKGLYGEGDPLEKFRRFVQVRELIAKGQIYEYEGALWFGTAVFGDDKDRVIIRSNEAPTYFASDILYHINKFERGFDKAIDIWGADHHGYVPRLKAAVKALGYPPDALEILLVQLVRLLRGGRPVAMSTRAGEFVTLAEVLAEVGKDAARYIFLTRRSDSPLDFDLELAKAQSLENPVYYVQYAHARLSSILREARKAGFPETYGDADLSLLSLPEEVSLIKKLAFYPEVVLGAALFCEPHRIPAYLQELAAQLHSYYNKHRVISKDRALSLARLALVASIRIVISNALSVLGVTAPERM